MPQRKSETYGTGSKEQPFECYDLVALQVQAYKRMQEYSEFHGILNDYSWDASGAAFFTITRSTPSMSASRWSRVIVEIREATNDNRRKSLRETIDWRDVSKETRLVSLARLTERLNHREWKTDDQSTS